MTQDGPPKPTPPKCPSGGWSQQRRWLVANLARPDSGLEPKEAVRVAKQGSPGLDLQLAELLVKQAASAAETDLGGAGRLLKCALRFCSPGESGATPDAGGVQHLFDALLSCLGSSAKEVRTAAASMLTGLAHLAPDRKDAVAEALVRCTAQHPDLAVCVLDAAGGASPSLWLPWAVRLIAEDGDPEMLSTQAAASEAVEAFANTLPRPSSPGEPFSGAELVANACGDAQDWISSALQSTKELEQASKHTSRFRRAVTLWALRARTDPKLRGKGRAMGAVNEFLHVLRISLSSPLQLYSLRAWRHLAAVWSAERNEKLLALLVRPVRADRARVWEGGAEVREAAAGVWIEAVSGTCSAAVFCDAMQTLVPVHGCSPLPPQLLQSAFGSMMSELTQGHFGPPPNPSDGDPSPAQQTSEPTGRGMPGDGIGPAVTAALLGSDPKRPSDRYSLLLRWWVACQLLVYAAVRRPDPPPPDGGAALLSRALEGLVATLLRLADSTTDAASVSPCAAAGACLREFSPLAAVTLQSKEAVAKQITTVCWTRFEYDAATPAFSDRAVEVLCVGTQDKPTTECARLLWGLSMCQERRMHPTVLPHAYTSLCKALVRLLRQYFASGGRGHGGLGSERRSQLASFLLKRKTWGLLLAAAVGQPADMARTDFAAQRSSGAVSAGHSLARELAQVYGSAEQHLVAALEPEPEQLYRSASPVQAMLQVAVWGHLPARAVASWAQWSVRNGLTLTTVVGHAADGVASSLRLAAVVPDRLLSYVVMGGAAPAKRVCAGSPVSGVVGLSFALATALSELVPADTKPGGSLYDTPFDGTCAEDVVEALSAILGTRADGASLGGAAHRFGEMLRVAAFSAAAPALVSALRTCRGISSPPEAELAAGRLVSRLDKLLATELERLQTGPAAGWASSAAFAAPPPTGEAAATVSGPEIPPSSTASDLLAVAAVGQLLGGGVAAVLKGGVLHLASAAISVWQKCVGSLPPSHAAVLRYPQPLAAALLAARQRTDVSLPGLSSSPPNASLPSLSMPADSQYASAAALLPTAVSTVRRFQKRPAKAAAPALQPPSFAAATPKQNSPSGALTGAVDPWEGELDAKEESMAGTGTARTGTPAGPPAESPGRSAAAERPASPNGPQSGAAADGALARQEECSAFSLKGDPFLWENTPAAEQIGAVGAASSPPASGRQPAVSTPARHSGAASAASPPNPDSDAGAATGGGARASSGDRAAGGTTAVPTPAAAEHPTPAHRGAGTPAAAAPAAASPAAAAPAAAALHSSGSPAAASAAPAPAALHDSGTPAAASPAAACLAAASPAAAALHGTGTPADAAHLTPAAASPHAAGTAAAAEPGDDARAADDALLPDVSAAAAREASPIRVATREEDDRAATHPDRARSPAVGGDGAFAAALAVTPKASAPMQDPGSAGDGGLRRASTVPTAAVTPEETPRLSAGSHRSSAPPAAKRDDDTAGGDAATPRAEKSPSGQRIDDAAAVATTPKRDASPATPKTPANFPSSRGSRRRRRRNAYAAAAAAAAVCLVCARADVAVAAIRPIRAPRTVLDTLDLPTPQREPEPEPKPRKRAREASARAKSPKQRRTAKEIRPALRTAPCGTGSRLPESRTVRFSTNAPQVYRYTAVCDDAAESKPPPRATPAQTFRLFPGRRPPLLSTSAPSLPPAPEPPVYAVLAGCRVPIEDVLDLGRLWRRDVDKVLVAGIRTVGDLAAMPQPLARRRLRDLAATKLHLGNFHERSIVSEALRGVRKRAASPAAAGDPADPPAKRARPPPLPVPADWMDSVDKAILHVDGKPGAQAAAQAAAPQAEARSASGSPQLPSLEPPEAAKPSPDPSPPPSPPAPAAHALAAAAPSKPLLGARRSAWDAVVQGVRAALRAAPPPSTEEWAALQHVWCVEMARLYPAADPPRASSPPCVRSPSASPAVKAEGAAGCAVTGLHPPATSTAPKVETSSFVPSFAPELQRSVDCAERLADWPDMDSDGDDAGPQWRAARPRPDKERRQRLRIVRPQAVEGQ
eukprot:TRINITY_DN1743_c0_g1_i1.p1 TRINITY_DN1743_c0_g1~~TRINITY_DN1743_c0_g1_i1.p1  ORF type:complete len:2025 (+),score=429.54 TRINITY_DN1743_c0_g1_i1:44-6118(+)